jgi:CBS domain-containing protein
MAAVMATATVQQMTSTGAELTHVRVRDAMHHGILTAGRAAPLHEVALLMAEHRVHAIVVSEADRPGRPWGIVTATDVAAAIAGGGGTTAADIADTEVVTVSADEPLDSAARMLGDQRLGHLIVVEAASGAPVGVLSALDIIAVYAA